jgi:outer membrane protein assembly factor BamB
VLKICLLVFLVLGCVVRPGYAIAQLADAQIEEAGNDVRAWLEHVNEFLKDEQWTDAVETMRRVMENRGDRLIEIPVDAQWRTLGFAAYVPLREYCQMQLASWHARAPQALELYRQQVDGIATRAYEEALEQGSEIKLQRVVDELLLSSVGDQALLRLGELALERGNYTLARRSWESIHPQLRVFPAAARLLQCAAGCSWWSALRARDWEPRWAELAATFTQPAGPVESLACPDSEIPLASVRARLVRVSLLEGSLDRARLEAELLKRLDPDASGVLGDRRGKLVDVLAEFMRNAPAWPGPPRPAGWSTFAGCPTRNGIAEQGVDIALRPVWRTSLPRLEDQQDRLSRGQLRVAEAADGLLGYHVAVDDAVVYICQPRAIRAIRLADGQPRWPVPAAGQAPSETVSDAIFQESAALQDVIPDRSAHAGVPRGSVTVDQGRLFARMGTAWMGGGDQSPLRDDQRSFLIGIDLGTQKLLFDRITPGAPGWEFEAAPLVSGARLYASLRRRDPASAQVKVACYAVETGRLIWQREIARGEAIGDVLFELANNPLSMADDTLYYNTNLGAVVALRASDGQVSWLCRYRRSGLSDDEADVVDRHFFRDVTPCLVDRGTLYVAAADCDRVFALDAGFGQVLWNTAAGMAADAVHLLGVARDRLVASGDYLYWIDASSGAVIRQFPAPHGVVRGYAGPLPRGLGRGILAGNAVYWPTRERIYVLDQYAGRQVRQPIELAALGLQGGNLVINDGVLLIASADALVAFNATGRIETRPDRDAAGRARGPRAITARNNRDRGSGEPPWLAPSPTSRKPIEP